VAVELLFNQSVYQWPPAVCIGLSQQQAKRQPFAVLLMNFEKNFFKILINTTKTK
jgi:hypothetical protein